MGALPATGPSNASFSKLYPVLAIVIVMTANLATIELFPIVWDDEVLFTDPAFNLAIDGRFVSTAWFDQPENKLWAGNAPLYSFVLAGWVRLFGTSIFAVRSFNLFLMSCAAILLVQAALRSGLLKSNTATVAAVLVVLLDYGIAINYRAGRYDCMGIFLVAWVVYGATLAAPARSFVIGFSCVPVAPSGLHVALYLSFIFAVSWVVLGARARPAIVAGFLGIAVGGILLLGTFLAFGVLDNFLATVARLRTISDGSAPKDPSYWLIGAGAISQIVLSRGIGWHRDPVLRLLVIVGFVTPALMYAGGRFPTYYTWMSVIPISTLLIVLFCTSGMGLGVRPIHVGDAIVVGFLGSAVLFGLPLQLATGAFYWQERDYDKVREAVEPIGPNDVVVTDASAYYAVRPRAKKTYLTDFVVGGRWLTRDQLDRINIIVARPEYFEAVAKQVGGQWKLRARFSPPNRELPIFGRRFGDKLIETYRIETFKRKGPSLQPSETR